MYIFKPRVTGKLKTNTLNENRKRPRRTSPELPGSKQAGIDGGADERALSTRLDRPPHSQLRQQGEDVAQNQVTSDSVLAEEQPGRPISSSVTPAPPGGTVYRY